LRILAIIPARSGSKRLPGKNKILLGGKPLFVWTVEAASRVPEICDILLSTDDEEILSIGKGLNILVPWMRPKKIASDKTPSVDVVSHALDWYENKNGAVDGVLLLQPTSPFRTTKLIAKSITLYAADMSCPVIGISPVHSHPLWMMKMDGDYCSPFFEDNALNMRSQDLVPAYAVNGSIYLFSPKHFRDKNSFFGAKNTPLLIDSEKESLDIDTLEDYERAAYFLEASSNSIRVVS
jgi:CMP-N-acetylneuraminic acid synthetase